MKIDFIPNLTGVFGYPVAENPTVLMMEAGYEAVGLDNWKYLTLEISPEKLKEAISCLRTFNMKGIHLTIPHKVAVLEYLDEISSVAKTMGAVNTVHNIDGKLVGENTQIFDKDCQLAVGRPVCIQHSRDTVFKHPASTSSIFDDFVQTASIKAEFGAESHGFSSGDNMYACEKLVDELHR